MGGLQDGFFFSRSESDGLANFCVSPESHKRIMSKKDRSNRSTEYAVMALGVIRE